MMGNAIMIGVDKIANLLLFPAGASPSLEPLEATQAWTFPDGQGLYIRTLKRLI